MRNLGGWEYLIILAVVLLLFGASRLPDLARSVGKSARIFRSEVKDITKPETPEPGAATPVSPGSVGTPVAPVSPASPVSPFSEPTPTDDDGERHRL